jgi:hypothetical protein
MSLFFDSYFAFCLDFKKRLPSPYANPRILSLDGGGVRGIVLIRILEHIEKMTTYKVYLSLSFVFLIFVCISNLFAFIIVHLYDVICLLGCDADDTDTDTDIDTDG